ncbi:MazG-like pyrophosphatase [Vibrio phage K24]|nr:MazG domain-containing protein [Vibrio phage 14E30.1]
MQLDEYQKLANEFATKDLPDDYAFTNGASEMGETMGKFSKYQRKFCRSLIDSIERCRNPKTIHDLNLNQDVKKELGDELWQLQRKATVCGFSLNELAESNLDKLTDRAERNLICGSGDNR